MLPSMYNRVMWTYFHITGMLLPLKDCWNICVSTGTISVLVCFKKVAFKLSEPGDLCRLQFKSRFVTLWEWYLSLEWIDTYVDVPLSGTLFKSSAVKTDFEVFIKNFSLFLMVQNQWHQQNLSVYWSKKCLPA